MSPTHPTSAESRTAPQAAAPLIWLIEDEELIGRLLEALLTSRGYLLRWFRSGEEAVEASLGSECPDCLVTDITLPGISGLEAAAHLSGTWPELPVLVISAYIFGGKLLEEPLPAEYEYLPKPFSPRTLMARLVEMVPLAQG